MMGNLSSQEALNQFLALCNEASAMEEFPWRKLLQLGYQAGFDRTVILNENSKGTVRLLTFYAETVIRAVVESENGLPSMTIWNNKISINGAVFTRMTIALPSDWLPMFKSYTASNSI